MPNSPLDRTAGSHSLAAAGQRDRSGSGRHGSNGQNEEVSCLSLRGSMV
jgi:hypothetical protein